MSSLWLYSDPRTSREERLLRTATFDLPFEQAGSQTYILQVTCLGTSSKRISSEFTVKLDE